MSIEIRGFCAPGFEGVRDVFARNFAERDELGARFAFQRDGETLVDIHAGWADRARTRAWGPQTLVPVFSTGKAVSALVMAWLVGEGRIAYADPVADHWPEFAQAGKGAITIAQALSHQAGLSGVAEEMDPAEWFDREAIERRIAAMTPLWPFDGTSGYHPISFGVIADAVARRADAKGRTIGAILAEEIAGPAGADVHIGLAESEHGRAAEHVLPKSVPDMGAIDPIKQAAFLNRWSSPGRRGAAAWRSAELPAANCHATAEGLATVLQGFARRGRIGETQRVAPHAVEQAMAERTAGPDRVLPFDLSFGAGVIRNRDSGAFGPQPETVGHYGMGGSCALADPVEAVTAAYTPNRMQPVLFGDERARDLIAAAYAAL